MLVDKQNELMSDLLFTVHQHGVDDVTWKPHWIILHWYACGADGRSGGRAVGVRSRDYQIFSDG